MKQIELTQNGVTLVDDEDFEKLNQFKWCVRKMKNTIYAYRGKRGIKIKTGVYGKVKMIAMHRFLLNITDRHILIDHKDGNGLNNQKSNLRPCTHAENTRNRKPNKNGTSKYLGVYRGRTKWEAKIQQGQTKIYLGSFFNEIEAAKKYNEAALKLHGEFARLNAV